MYRYLEADGLGSKCATAGAASMACKTNLNTQSIDLGIEMDM
jgi:hypothetical protein